MPSFANTFVLATVALAGVVSAANLRTPVPRTLMARQSSSVPTACQSTCKILDTIQACADDTCACTNSNTKALATCVQCLANLDPADADQYAGLLGQFEDACNSEGFHVSSYSITGGAASTSAGAGGSVSATRSASLTDTSPSATFVSATDTDTPTSTGAASQTTVTALPSSTSTGLGASTAAPSASRTTADASATSSASGAGVGLPSGAGAVGVSASMLFGLLGVVAVGMGAF